MLVYDESQKQYLSIFYAFIIKLPASSLFNISDLINLYIKYMRNFKEMGEKGLIPESNSLISECFFYICNITRMSNIMVCCNSYYR